MPRAPEDPEADRLTLLATSALAEKKEEDLGS